LEQKLHADLGIQLESILPTGLRVPLGGSQYRPPLQFSAGCHAIFGAPSAADFIGVRKWIFSPTTKI
jgi:hypothetical protein